MSRTYASAPRVLYRQPWFVFAHFVSWCIASQCFPADRTFSFPNDRSVSTVSPRKPVSAEKLKVGRDAEVLADYLLTGLHQSRSELHSGEFEMTSETISRRTGGEVHKQTTSFCVFDGDFQRFRFDRKDVTNVQGVIDARATEKQYAVEAKYVRTNALSIATEGNNTVARIQSPTTPPNALVEPFDVRATGLLNYMEMLSGMRLRGDEMRFDGVMDFYRRKHRVVSVADEGAGLFQIVFTYGKDMNSERRLWLDAKTGFAPTRMEVRTRPGPNAEYSIDPRVLSISKWKAINNTWVPVSLRIESYFNNDVLEAEFTWKQVNGPVDDFAFTVEGLNLPEGRPLENGDFLRTVVMDDRRQESIRVRGGEVVESGQHMMAPGQPNSGRDSLCPQGLRRGRHGGRDSADRGR